MLEVSTVQQTFPPILDVPGLEDRLRARGDEVDDLMALLLEHADPHAGSLSEIQGAAWRLAAASLGDQHLWQDLGLPSREALTQLIAHWFPALAARNVGRMRWKKFLYRQMCLKEGIQICKSPTCANCDDHAECFGAEGSAPRLSWH
jgi:nitrogen fixation protein NifQ